jgi:mannose-6-phosphate isomerase-like protein (cupin superfamily)
MITEDRPWGSFVVLVDKPSYKVKSLLVNPGHRLSLQKHNHRTEYWTMVAGKGQVRIGDQYFMAEVGATFFIPIGVLHRIQTFLHSSLTLIEVQLGSYFGEDDIERLEDDFGAHNESR